MFIKNYMEEIVFLAIKDVMKKVNVCSCEKCIMDIAAIALNDLPPKYIVTSKGELYSKINSLKQQFDVDVVTAVTKAAVIVKEAPDMNNLRKILKINDTQNSVVI